MQELQQLYARGQTHELLYFAHQILQQQSDMPELAYLTLKTLVESGLGGPARELIQLRQDLPTSSPQVAGLNHKLSELPHGRVPWRERASLFTSNYEMLSTRGVAIPEKRVLLDTLKGWQLFATTTGEHLLSARAAGQLRQWTPPLSSRQTEREMQLPAHGQLGPLGIAGIADGDLFKKLLDLTKNVFLTRSHPLFIVEPDLTRFAAWLHTADHNAFISEQRVMFFVGPNALSNLQACLEAEPNLQVPQQFVTLGGKSAEMNSLQEILEAVVKNRHEELQELTQVLREREIDRDSAFWLKRWEKPGTVLAITSRFTTVLQYSSRATIDAFETLGYQGELLIESEDHEALSPLYLARRIRDLDPDLIVLLDHLRCEHSYQPLRTPVWTWIQDPLPNLMNAEAGASVGEFDFVSGYHRQRCIDEFGYPHERFFGHVIPVSESVFHSGPVEPDVAEAIGADMVYVGHLTQTAVDYHAKLRKDVSDKHRALVDALWEDVQTRLSEGNYVMQIEVDALVNSICNQLGLKLSTAEVAQLADFGFFRLYDLVYREQALKWAAVWAQSHQRKLKIYGKGWEQLTAVAEYAAGPVEHGEALRQVYRSTTLVLQLNPSGFLNQRTYEALLSGALVLVRYSPNNFAGMSIAKYEQALLDGRDLPDCGAQQFANLSQVVFESQEELNELANGYLNDHQKRHTLQQEFSDIVLERHTYAQCVRGIRDQIRHQLAHRAKQPANPVPSSERACV